jgi:hypothetical protein
MSASTDVVAARGSVLETTRGAAVQPNPVLGVLMQMATAGAFVGSLVAYRRRRNDPTFDPVLIVTRWSVAGFALGVVIVVLEAIA